MARHPEFPAFGERLEKVADELEQAAKELKQAAERARTFEQVGRLRTGIFSNLETDFKGMHEHLLRLEKRLSKRAKPKKRKSRH